MKRAHVRGLVLTVWSIVLAVGACQSDTPRCIPHASIPCACTDGRQGAQLCNVRGELEVCVCRDTDAGAPPDRVDVLAIDSNVSDATPQGDANVDVAVVIDDQSPVDTGARADALDAGDAADASDAGTPLVDSGAPTPDAVIEPPVDASPEPPRVTGGFTSASGVSGPELTGSFSWSAAVYATGGGITLEGSFQ